MLVSDLKNYKDGLYSALCRDISEFEKNFLFIAGGILAFSITFIKDIIKVDTAKVWFLLFAAWGFIILSIALMMFAFLRSAVFSDKLWKVTDDFLISNQLYSESTLLTTLQIDSIKGQINTLFYKGKIYLKKLRYFSVGSFILGLILFSLFVGINLLKENKNLVKIKSNKIISIKI